MNNCPKCKKSDEVVTRPDGTKYCLDCGERVAERPSDATACSGLVGKLGYFIDAGKRICFAEVKAENVECPWAEKQLAVLYQRWPDPEKYDGHIDPEDFRPIPCQNASVLAQPGETSTTPENDR